jgi:N-acetyl-1-D-myo-inositol-2-amino-2-deoxy-alpha-D-glucopyranoside deacetylase
MAGTPSAGHPDAFVRADPGEAAAMVAAHIRAVRPDVVVTYDEQGGYAHPDHVQTHRVTMLALSMLAAEAVADGLAGPRAFCILTPASWAAQDRAWLRDNVLSDGSNCIVPQQDEPYPPSVVPDAMVTHVVEESTVVGLQSRALAEHATQVVVHNGYYALSNHIVSRLSGREGFAQFDPVAGRLMPATPGAPPRRGLLDGPPDGLQAVLPRVLPDHSEDHR